MLVAIGLCGAALIQWLYFVASDRLARDPSDRDALRQLERALAQAQQAAAPYGMDRVWWDGVQADKFVPQLAELERPVTEGNGATPTDRTFTDLVSEMTQ